MQMDKKIYCHWDLVRFVTEDLLTEEDGTFLTLSVTDGGVKEYMIFLGKSDSEYEVRVHKAKPNDKYIPYESDNVDHYEENDEYATFFFKKFDDAIHFASILGYAHPEYIKRLIRIIDKDN